MQPAALHSGKGSGGGGGGSNLSYAVAAGQRRPTKLSAAPPVFSIFTHLPDEFERAREAKRAHFLVGLYKATNAVDPKHPSAWSV
jgi:hypothetical protein